MSGKTPAAELRDALRPFVLLYELYGGVTSAWVLDCGPLDGQDMERAITVGDLRLAADVYFRTAKGDAS